MDKCIGMYDELKREQMTMGFALHTETDEDIAMNCEKRLKRKTCSVYSRRRAGQRKFLRSWGLRTKEKQTGMIY